MFFKTVPGLGSRGEVLEILEDGGNLDWLLAMNAGGVRGWVPRSGVSGFSGGGGGGGGEYLRFHAAREHAASVMPCMSIRQGSSSL